MEKIKSILNFEKKNLREEKKSDLLFRSKVAVMHNRLSAVGRQCVG